MRTTGRIEGTTSKGGTLSSCVKHQECAQPFKLLVSKVDLLGHSLSISLMPQDFCIHRLLNGWPLLKSACWHINIFCPLTLVLSCRSIFDRPWLMHELQVKSSFSATKYVQRNPLSRKNHQEKIVSFVKSELAQN